MKLFGKKKEEDEDALIERLTGSGNAEKPDKEGPKKGGADAEVEKLSAQVNAIREVLQAQRERFERQSEEIGELRSALAERERQMRDLEAKALKASELVEEVQPETLMAEQKKIDAKIEAIKAKLENGESISSNIIEELKRMKGSISLFRGTEGLVALNKEVQEELKNIKKVEAVVEKHADRVEALFSSFETNFGEFEKMKDGIVSATETCAAIKKETERNSVAIKEIPKKDEIYQLKKELESTLATIRNEKSIYEKRNASVESASAEALKKIKTIEAAIESAEKKESENSQKINEMMNLLDKMANLIARGKKCSKQK